MLERLPFWSRLFARNALDTPIPASPPRGEIAWREDSFFQYPTGRYSADDLVGRKGRGIYKKMLDDPQVRAAYQIKNDIILGRRAGFVLPDEPTPEQEDCAKLFEWNIEQGISGTWMSALRTIQQAKQNGFSITEKVYKAVDYQGQTRWVIRRLAGKDPWSFEFETDPYGNVLALYQDQDTARKRLPLSKFIHHVNNPESDPIYGRSDLRAIYRAWWEKDKTLSMWNIYVERAAGGFVHAKVEGSLTPTEEQDLRDTLSNIQARSSVKTGKNVTIEFIQPPATDAHEKKVAWHDKQISKGLLLPDLMGVAERGETGSRALGDTQLEVLYKTIQHDGDALADTVNEQLFREMAFWNYGLTEYPLYQFDPLTDEQKRIIAHAWREAVTGKVVHNTLKDENATRRMLGYDEITEEELPDDPLPPAGDPDPEEQDPQDPDQPAPDDPPARAAQASARQHFATRNPYPWRDRVQFERIKDGLNSGDRAFATDIALAIDRMVNEATAAATALLERRQAENKTEITDDLAQLDQAVSPETKAALNRAIRGHLATGYEQGRAEAITEIEQAAIKAGPAMAARIRTTAKLSARQAVNPRKVGYREDGHGATTWSVAHFISGVDLATAEDYFSAKSFKLTGDLTQEVIDAVRQIVLNGIRDEKSIQAIAEEITRVLEPFMGPVDDGGRRTNVGARAETIARTNIIEAFNQARLAVFADPDLGDFVEALEYSAILDGRETPFCRAYDGKIFRRTDPIWERITPPNHFNCRSTIIPVTAVDEYEESNPLGSAIEPARGFG